MFFGQAGQAAGAWSAARRGHASGALLMAETYILLIHGHLQVREGFVDPVSLEQCLWSKFESLR